ncbi:hypothetical protein DKX38_027288 [Salix brachista]|uniref:Uncharacterized protein n=1 Tax=Salix brachista TaxID=2182728 RepID=A0A5N5JFQ4_9ROSI|nr:hypothetical protein DKX38_027288 [Salix brachista]
MAIGEIKELPKSWAMLGGDGPESYTLNSSYQKGVVDASMEMVDDGIMEKLDLKSLGFESTNDTFRIADFGCSVGPNTFFAVENIMKAVEHKHHAQFNNSAALSGFQVFFNDVTTNDFNTLFKALHSNEKYFSAGLPGTFFGRLLPRSTLHSRQRVSRMEHAAASHNIWKTSRETKIKVSVTGGRAVFQGLLEDHFGREVTEKTFENFETKLDENFSIIDGAAHEHIDHFILLKRNVN